MNYRENFMRVIKRNNPEYVPFDLDFCQSLEKAFYEKTGLTEYRKYYEIKLAYVEFNPTQKSNDYSKYFSKFPEKVFFDEWGTGYIPGSVAHFAHMVPAIGDFTFPDQVWEFPEPDILEDYRWEGVADRVKELKEMDMVVCNGYAAEIFTSACYLRGIDNIMADMIADEEMAKACIDKITRLKAGMSAKFAEAGVDVMIYGDDVGTQRAMMISPDLWRKWLKPALKTAIDAAKAVNPDVIIFYHSCGYIYDIINELIEIGVEVLNPIQPECMDPVKLKEEFGDKLSFWGTIGTQTTLPFGTPDDVYREVKYMIETVGKGGGLIITPSHTLEPEVPWENIESFVNAARKYGRY